jgi:hypothetical protein
MAATDGMFDAQNPIHMVAARRIQAAFEPLNAESELQTRHPEE